LANQVGDKWFRAQVLDDQRDEMKRINLEQRVHLLFSQVLLEPDFRAFGMAVANNQ